MAKKQKNVVITDVYSVISADRTSMVDLTREFNDANRRAFKAGKRMWKPVGGPIIRDHCGAQILVVREDELDLDE
jgi:hypothetical protein